MPDTIKLLLVDDQALLRQALANLLGQTADFKIVGTASDGYEAIEKVALHRPDVVLLDIEMPNLDGISATRLISQRFPKTRIILLSAHDNKTYLLRALRAGAKAYLLKDTLSDELVDTIRKVHKGYGQFGPGLLEKMVAGIDDAGGSQVPSAASEVAYSQSNSSGVPVLEADLAQAFSRFEPEELRTLIQTLRRHPKGAIALRPKLEQRLTMEPANLAALILQGALARSPWNLPQVALASLKTGYQLGLQQELSPDSLLLFYQEAVAIRPEVAFGWLTQVRSPWNTYKRLPFLLKEAAVQFGTASSQYRALRLLYQMRSLKGMFPKRTDASPSSPKAGALKPASAIPSVL